MALRWLSDVVGTKKTTFNIALAVLTAAGLSAARTYTLPDAAGTLALLERAQTFTAAQTYSSTVTINASAAAQRLTLYKAANAAAVAIEADAGLTAEVHWRTGTSDRYTLSTDGVAESGGNAGTGIGLFTHSDAGASLGSVFTVTRANRVLNFTVAPTFTDAATTRTNLGLLSAATHADTDYVHVTGTENVGGAKTFTSLLTGSLGASFTGGNLTLDRTAGATTATLAISVAAAQIAQISFQTNGVDRWILRKNVSAESGSDAGSNLELRARSDAGADLGAVWSVTRSSRIVNFNVSPTVPNVAASDSSTKVANTKYVDDAVALVSGGGLAHGQVMARIFMGAS